MNNSQIEIRKKRLELLAVPQTMVDVETITFSGTAIRWNEPTEDKRSPALALLRGCVSSEFLATQKIAFNIGHEGEALATTNDNLSVWAGNRGLHWSGDLPYCDVTRQMAWDVQSGKLSGSSASIEGLGKERTMAVGKRVFVMHTLTGIQDVCMCREGANPKSTCRVLWPWQQSKPEARRPTAKVENNRSTRRRNRRPLTGFTGFLKAHDSLPAFVNARRQGLTVEQLSGSGMQSMQWAESKMYVADKSEACGWRYVGR